MGTGTKGGVGPLCGHGTASAAVSRDRCWDCHLAYLRDTGQHERAELIVKIKREHDEGRVDLEALEEGMVDLLMNELGRDYDEAAVPRGPTRLPRNGPSRLRGSGRPW